METFVIIFKGFFMVKFSFKPVVPSYKWKIFSIILIVICIMDLVANSGRLWPFFHF